MKVRVFPAEEVPGVLGEGWVDRTRRPYFASGRAWVPVKEGHPFDEELPERRPFRGRGYQMIGDIALIHGHAPSLFEVQQIIDWKKPRAVVHIDSYEGPKRIPRARVHYGTAGEVVHREQGFSFILDPTKVMFAQGNREEKARIATLISKSKREERVADMFAGIGYFTVPAAANGAMVHAMELNSVAFDYLVRTIDLNHVSGQVTAECGDSRHLLTGCYDRVIMGHFDAVDMLDAVFPHVESGSIIHVHSIGDMKERIAGLAREAGFSARVTSRNVKKYAPRQWHMVHDVMLA